jgi:hypothetical protein
MYEEFFFHPFTYEELRKHVVAAVGEEYAAKIDKLAGHKP